MLVHDTRVAVMGVMYDMRSKEFQKNTGLTILARARFKSEPENAISAFNEVNAKQGNNASAYIWWTKREEQRGYTTNKLVIRIHAPLSVGVTESRNNMQRKVADQFAKLLIEDGIFVSLEERKARYRTMANVVSLTVYAEPQFQNVLRARASWHSIWGLDDIPFQGTYWMPKVDNYRSSRDGYISELDKLQAVHAATVRVLKSRQISLQVSNISKQTQSEPIFHGTAAQVLSQMGKTQKVRDTKGRFTAKVAVA
jgi:hypothetical protein